MTPTNTPEAARLAEERQRFEAVARKEGCNRFTTVPDGDYVNDKLFLAWRIWLAAKQDAAPTRASTVPEWMPIETAPRDLAPMLLWLPAVGGWNAGPWRGSWSYVEGGWTLHTPLLMDGKAVCLTKNPDPTHWMPLPPTPDRGLRIAEKGNAS